MEIRNTEPRAQALINAIQKGDVEVLRQLLDGDHRLSKLRIVDTKGVSRTLLHIAVDWPGHFPRVSQSIRLLVDRGADPDAPMVGGIAPERPLHGAASCNDVDALDALLDGGANIESPGAVFTNGAAMSDAVIFAQWDAARRLLERGAKTTFTESAALGLLDRLATYFEQEPKPSGDQMTAALWHACRGGQLQTAKYLAGRGANMNWVGWDKIAPLDGAQQSGNQDLVAWLLNQGAKSAREIAASTGVSSRKRLPPAKGYSFMELNGITLHRPFPDNGTPRRRRRRGGCRIPSTPSRALGGRNDRFIYPV